MGILEQVLFTAFFFLLFIFHFFSGIVLHEKMMKTSCRVGKYCREHILSLVLFAGEEMS